MKKVFLAITIVCSATMVAQIDAKSKKTEIPANVKEAFQKEFPAQKAKWEMEDGGYEAEFKMKGNDVSAVYDKKGHRKAFETGIKTNELPATVLGYMAKNYASKKITEATKIADDKNVTTYEAEIKKDGKPYDVLFDSNGKFIKIVEAD